MLEIKQNIALLNFTKQSSRVIKYIVIHYTANNGDTAYNNTQYFKSKYIGSSAHYFVDENEAWQSVLDNNIAWHCGKEKNGQYYHGECRNNNSLGIELCSRKDSNGNYYFKEETVENAIKLVKYLIDKYKIPAKNVIRHYDVTHKTCPAPFVENVELWNEFIERINESEENTMNEKITDVNVAIDVLSKEGIIKDKEYWTAAVNYQKNVNYLLLNMANYTK